MEQQRQELDSWKELVKKAINVETKASLQPQSILREMDQRCPHGNRPSHSTLAKSQTFTRDFRDDPIKKPEAPAPKPPNSSRSESSKTFDKKAQKKKKKQRRLDLKQEWKDSSSTPPIGANNCSGTSKDLTKIICFNCKKKRHYSRNCSTPEKNASKNYYRSWRPPFQRLRLVKRLSLIVSIVFDIRFVSEKIKTI